MNHRDDLTQSALKENLDYDQGTGFFTRKKNVGGRKIGDICRCKHHEGYIVISVKGFTYHANRLAVLYMTGRWPVEHVDHINGVRDDDRWCNLREATNAENTRNKKKHSNNTSGFKGVYLKKDRNKWGARITVNGDQIHLGYFDDINDANKAYRLAANKYHGEFACY